MNQFFFMHANFKIQFPSFYLESVSNIQNASPHTNCNADYKELKLKVSSIFKILLFSQKNKHLDPKCLYIYIYIYIYIWISGPTKIKHFVLSN